MDDKFDPIYVSYYSPEIPLNKNCPVIYSKNILDRILYLSENDSGNIELKLLKNFYKKIEQMFPDHSVWDADLIFVHWNHISEYVSRVIIEDLEIDSWIQIDLNSTTKNFVKEFMIETKFDGTKYYFSEYSS